MSVKLFVCNKVDECNSKLCQHNKPHEHKDFCDELTCASSGLKNVKCVEIKEESK